MAGSAFSHVPYIEHDDYTEQSPFEVMDSVENSKAIYAWFESGTDIDVYTFEIREPQRVYINVLVPVCPGYEELLPEFALVGPGLPDPEEQLPFTIPEGYGAMLAGNLMPGEPRETFFEPFGGKFYYDGPAFDQEVTDPGSWYIYYWDPYDMGGDYVAVFGHKERFSLTDIVRALFRTPQIWFDRELHRDCP